MSQQQANIDINYDKMGGSVVLCPGHTDILLLIPLREVYQSYFVGSSNSELETMWGWGWPPSNMNGSLIIFQIN